MLRPPEAVQPGTDCNIARHLTSMAAAHPSMAALKIPNGRTAAGEIRYVSLSFAELEAEVNAWCARLHAAGVKPGDRTLVMVRQGLPLIASAFAVFRLGAVPVIIDPGMGLKSFLNCVRHSHPRVLLGIPLAQFLGHIFRPSFRSVEIRVGVSNQLTARLTKTAAAAQAAMIKPVSPPAGLHALAAILFTSGSTGAPKGVCYQHGMFDAQVRLIRETYGIEPGEIDLPLLPIFALFNPALGMTTVVPEMDPRRPAAVNPAAIVQAIQQEGVTNSFGSPTLWRKIGDHCVANGLTLPSLRRVLCAGAPVPAVLWQASSRFLPHGALHSPYGATEALPVATVSTPEIDSSSLHGACVGRPVRGVTAKVIAITDGRIASLADARELPTGEVGEIIVQGPVVTQEYDGRPDATAAAKIAPQAGGGSDGAGAPTSTRGALNSEPGPSDAGSAAPAWHRMGDCGYFDGDGRLWFVGRKIERVVTAQGTLHTEPCEQVFRRHPRVSRCALIGLGPAGQQRPALVVEIKLQDSAQCRALARELALLAREHRHTEAIRTFYFRPKFPVDVRHNAKIHRLTLARWAAKNVGYESDPKR